MSLIVLSQSCNLTRTLPCTAVGNFSPFATLTCDTLTSLKSQKSSRLLHMWFDAPLSTYHTPRWKLTESAVKRALDESLGGLSFSVFLSFSGFLLLGFLIPRAVFDEMSSPFAFITFWCFSGCCECLLKERKKERNWYLEFYSCGHSCNNLPLTMSLVNFKFEFSSAMISGS